MTVLWIENKKMPDIVGHFFEMRGSSHADTEIRELALTMFRLVKEEGPNIFADMDVILDDGVEVIEAYQYEIHENPDGAAIEAGREVKPAAENA